MTNVPMKTVVDEDENPPLHHLLAMSKDGTRNFFPQDMIPLNCGSNEGLSRIIRKLYDDHKDSDKYIMLCVDENIFKRILPVRMPFRIASIE